MATTGIKGAAARRANSLRAVASRQLGLFTRAQATQAGFSRGSIDKRVNTGVWLAIDYGVYRVTETPSSWRQRLLAACLAGPAVASHRAAAALWGFPSFDEAELEVTALRHRRRKPSDVIWHESVRLDDRQVSVLDSIPTTRAVRTLLDLGAVVGVPRLLLAFDDAVRRSLASRTALEVALEGFGNRRVGSGTVRKMLLLRPPGGPTRESSLETLFDLLVDTLGLPSPRAQYTVTNESGEFVARVDYAFVAARVVIEIDGARTHAGEADWRADLARQNRIAAEGWLVLRFTADDLTRRPAEVAARIRSTLQSRRASVATK
jgi:hypothetical protein